MIIQVNGRGSYEKVRSEPEITLPLLPLDPGEAGFHRIAIIDRQPREIPVFRFIGNIVHDASHDIIAVEIPLHPVELPGRHRSIEDFKSIHRLEYSRCCKD